MTASPWFEHAVRSPIHGVPASGGGSMVGGAPRATHHTTEGGSISGAEATYAKTGNLPHCTVDYARDIVHQHLPVTVAATALKNPPGGVQTNRQGTVNIQTEWVGFAQHPFTSDGHGGLVKAGPVVRAYFDWLRAHGIPDGWPMGAPKAYPSSYGERNGDRDAHIWTTTAGHYGHSQVPENEHGDPGAIDPAFIRQSAHSQPASKPVTKPAPQGYRYTHLPLKQGDHNADVEHAQHRLGIHADGWFGDATGDHVEAFRHAHHLPAGRTIDAAVARLLG